MTTFDSLFLFGTAVFFGYMMLVYKVMQPITRLDGQAAADFARKTKPWRMAGAGIGCAYLILLATYLAATISHWIAG